MRTRSPDYLGGSIVNVAAELERRLTGSAPSPGLHDGLVAVIPGAPSYVLVLFDGLGDHQLAHPAAATLADARAGAVDAPFPSTTTVSLSSIATGTPPAVHGLLGYELLLPESGGVVRTIKWTTLSGDAATGIDHDAFLPAPNLWERLADAGLEPITVQPWNFAGTRLSRTLYRGCRFEVFGDEREAAVAAAELAAVPGRLVFLYVPHVDFAAHVSGQDSPEYASALQTAGRIWGELTRRLDGSAAVGIADHGHVDVPEERRIRIPTAEHQGRTLYGDARALYVRGRDPLDLAGGLPATAVPMETAAEWLGPGARHPSFADRVPDAVLLADPGYALLHRHANDRLIGQHGGLTPEELRVPLLVAG